MILCTHAILIAQDYEVTQKNYRASSPETDSGHYPIYAKLRLQIRLWSINIYRSCNQIQASTRSGSFGSLIFQVKCV